MNIINNKISNELIINLKKIFDENKNLFDENNNKINYINIYHKDWKINKYQDLIEQLKLESNILNNYIVNNNICYMGFIQSYPNCDNQYFHLDYFGKTITFFIPFLDLNFLNSTEFLYFYNNDDYNKYFKNLLDISNKFIKKEDLINYLSNNLNLIYKKDFELKNINTNMFSLLEMPNYLLHRGIKNLSDKNRIMFQITFLINNDDINNLNINSKKFINDAELDDENKELILKNRLA